MGVLYGRLAEFDRERLHPIRRWIVVAGCLIVLLPGLLSLSEYLEWRDPNWIETWTVQMLAGVAWFIFAVDGIITIVKSVPTSWTTVLVYWGVAFIATGAGVGSVLCDEGLCEQLSSAWHMLGVVATALAVFSVNRVESRSTFRHLFVYIAGTLLTGIVLISILLIAPGIFSGSRLLFGVIITSGILGVAYQVLHRVIRETIDRFLFGHAVDYAKHLNTLAGRVRNVLDPEQLAEIMMITVQESLGVDRGALLVGDTGDDEIRDVTFQVVGHLEHKVSESPKFRAFSPFMDDLRRRGLTLTQDVLDADPRFQAVREHEREWLKSLGMHLFVPLRSRGQLIGIFALGQKKGGKAYEADEIEFLIEVANRSGYTLDNARLFDYMRTLNAVFDRLYTDLDEVNRRLQEMDKLKSAFISVITHELRSPLVGIDFSLQLLKRQEWDKLAPEQQEPIRDIDNGFGQLKSMIDNLVAFAAFLSKQGELRKEEIDFALVLQETIAPLEMMAQTRQMVLRVQMPDRLPCIWADKERISEAMYHLVHNAIKFNRPQGQIEISCAADQEVIRFQVTDTGSGVEAEKLETIWDSFSQSADTLRRGVEGLGLGLALVKYIVSAHGGEVWANSRPNQGSTFGFQIPLGQPERSAIDQVSLMLSDRDQLLKR
ncbi:MAG: HAMP domain-containing histidine kinase [Anaerolineae bacterium]|nr:HAMP domain-containing histidine kinase [Anaerolineae bacterium]